MQIYYCDACGLRVNNSELVPTGEKVYCSACAQKLPTQELPIPRRTPSAGVQMAPPRSGEHKLPTPQRGTQANVRSPFGSGEGHAARHTGGHEVKPRTGHTGSVPRPASASARGATTGAKTKDNSTLLYAGAGAGAMLLVVVLVFASRGNPEPEKPATETKPPDSVAKVEPTPPTPPAKVEPAKPPTPLPPADTGLDDIRETRARAEYATVQQQVRSAGGNILAIRRAYLDFIRRYRTTKSGQEAIAQYEATMKSASRAADNAGSTVQGLKCEIYERSKDQHRIRGINYGGLKKIAEKTIERVDFGDRSKVGAALGREDNVIAVFSGFIEVPADGEYSFYVNSDDASLLYIGDWLVVENDDSHAAREYGDIVPLKKGKHRIRLEYSQGEGLAQCNFSIAGPNMSKMIVPPNMLSRNP